MAYDIVSEIIELKKQKGVSILAHYYQEGEVQDIADHIGDSFFLAKMGQQVPETNILLAGVVFMGESVKLLNPEKTVLVPDLAAGCSLVKASPFNDYLKWRQRFPTGIGVTYINSSAEVKAISDVIVTSSNAEKIIDQIPKDRPILFGPDRNLGRYLSKKLNRPFELWQGVCEVHVLFSARRLHELKLEHPDALVIAHPECEESILNQSDIVGSTSHLLSSVERNSSKKFIVATETGILHQMKKSRPDAVFIQAPSMDTTCACNDCPYMKLNSLEKIKKTLLTFDPEIKLPDHLKGPARISLDRMMDITSGKKANWPEVFQWN